MKYFVLSILFAAIATAAEESNIEQPKPPARKPLEFGRNDEVSDEVFAGTVNRLFEEYISEKRRVAAGLKQNDKRLPSNEWAIVKDFATLLECDSRRCIYALVALPERNVEWPGGRQLVTPAWVLNDALRVRISRNRDEAGRSTARQLKGSVAALDALLDRPQPPNAEEWRNLQACAKLLRTHVACLTGEDRSLAARLEFEPVSFVFNNASLGDILNSAIIQAGLSLDVEAPVTPEEIKNAVVPGRISVEDEPAGRVMKMLLDPRGLSYRLVDDPKNPHVLICRKPAAQNPNSKP